MISVLIPTYNYDVSKLIATIHSQLIKSAITFEILVFEDGSTHKTNSSKNLSNTSIIINNNNIGRVKARQELAARAKYDWLLFLDADIMPKTKQFISNYISAITLDHDAIFGGFTYYDSKPKPSYRLRWKYGKTKEQVLASLRNQSPYKVIISANFLIKKKVFSTINYKIQHNKSYGFDNYFGALLQNNNVNIVHIDNEAYHLGIEKSEVYLKKKEQAALTLLHFYKTKGITTHSNDLLNLFSKLNRYKLTWFLSFIYKTFKSTMQKNLLNHSPSITILQLYRISYMCHAYKNNIRS